MAIVNFREYAQNHENLSIIKNGNFMVSSY